MVSLGDCAAKKRRRAARTSAGEYQTLFPPGEVFEEIETALAGDDKDHVAVTVDVADRDLHAAAGGGWSSRSRGAPTRVFAVRRFAVFIPVNAKGFFFAGIASIMGHITLTQLLSPSGRRR